MALTPIPTNTVPLLAAIRESISTQAPDVVLLRTARAASALVEEYAPLAPDDLRDESLIRTIGWLLTRPHGGVENESSNIGAVSVSKGYQAGQLSCFEAFRRDGLAYPIQAEKGRAGMTWWPWRTEHRASVQLSYTDAVLQRQHDLALGVGVGDPSKLAALEIASGIWGAGPSRHLS